MKTVKIILTVFVLVSFGFFLYQTDFQLTIETLKKVGLNAFCVLLSTFVAYFLGTIGWYYCLENRNVSWFKLFLYRSIGETLSLFNPTSIIAGDALKALYLENHGISRLDTARSVVLSRIWAIVSQMLLLLIALVVLGTNIEYPPIETHMWFAIPIVILSLVFVLRWCYLRFLAPKFGPILKEYFNSTVQFVKQYPTQAWISFLMFFAHWIVGALELYILLHILGYDISVLQSIFMDMGIIVVKAMGAFVPGQAGVEELGNKWVLQGIGIASTHVWLSISILRRMRQLFWALFGFAAYLLTKKYGSPIRQS